MLLGIIRIECWWVVASRKHMKMPDLYFPQQLEVQVGCRLFKTPTIWREPSSRVFFLIRSYDYYITNGDIKYAMIMVRAAKEYVVIIGSFRMVEVHGYMYMYVTLT